jgi:hypothetical protein
VPPFKTESINMNSGVILGFATILLFAVLYFVPMGIAIARKHRNTGAIVALNMFLGWTMVGWVLALVWALMVTDKERCAS